MAKRTVLKRHAHNDRARKKKLMAKATGQALATERKTLTPELQLKTAKSHPNQREDNYAITTIRFANWQRIAPKVSELMRKNAQS